MRQPRSATTPTGVILDYDVQPGNPTDEPWLKPANNQSAEQHAERPPEPSLLTAECCPAAGEWALQDDKLAFDSSLRTPTTAGGHYAASE